jgi:hypothetical protein
MKQTLGVLALCSFIAFTIISIHWASAYRDCATVLVNAPVAGPHTLATCVPEVVPLPRVTVSNCDTFSQLGVQACETVETHAP